MKIPIGIYNLYKKILVFFNNFNTYRSKGYAFVEFKNEEDFNAVLKMETGEICKRLCRIVKSDRPITEKKQFFKNKNL